MSQPTAAMIDTPEGLQAFADANREVEWMAFDTEFIGEKRYYTLLCLIQVATENGYYFIDPIELDNLDPFLDLIEDERIVKITHAGENDYRLLYQEFGVMPRNVFDTQVAAGFVGYPYPISFRNIVDGEAGVLLAKGFAVTDWERRPLQPKQLKYALDDVLYLKEVYDNLRVKLSDRGRTEWAATECAVWETEEYYYRNPYAELYKSNLIHKLKMPEKLLLLRLHQWRNTEAERRNHSKEMVLAARLIGPIVRAVPQGLKSMRNNRRLSDRLVDRYGQKFVDLHQKPATEEELAIIKAIPRQHYEEDARFEIITEMLYLMVSYKCLDEEMATNIVMPRAVLKELKFDKEKFPKSLEAGWREEFMGSDLLNWLRNRKDLRLRFADGKMELELR